MRIEATAATQTHLPSDNLTKKVRDLAATAPSTELFLQPTESGWKPVTAAQFNDLISAIGKGLIARGVNLGTRVALMSPTRYEWVVLDYANWAVGGSTVAVYETSSPAQVEHIMTDSSAMALITGDRVSADRVATGVPAAAPVWVIDDGLIDALVADGKSVSDADYAARVGEVTAAAEATLVYTSGTTGKPKGVVLTHHNLLAQYDAVHAGQQQISSPGDSTVMFLPLAHIFARVISVVGVQHEIRVAHTSDLANLTALFAELKPSYILSVPRVFEKVYNSMAAKAEEGGKTKIFNAAVDTAIAYSTALDTGGPGLALRLKHALFDKLVYSKLRDALGGQCRSALSGGAALGARLGHFFRGAGVPVYEGYGLSESSAAVTVNTVTHHRIGTVGRPVPGQEVAIADDGEVLLRGPVIFDGYWGLPEANADAFRDGWFHTGDLGSLDDDGYLSITGRKKEILVTAAGKNVAPATAEDALRRHPLISQAMLVGDHQPFVGALITLDEEALPGWLAAHDLPEQSVAEATKNESVLAEIGSAVDRANSLVSNAEQVKKWRVLAADFSIDGGELTPTLKVKRNVVMDKHASEVEAIYS